MKKVFRQPAHSLIFVLTFLLYATNISAGSIPDPSFGNNGKVRLSLTPGSLPGSTNTARSATLQTDGKIILVGLHSAPGQGSLAGDMAIVRLNTDGSSDNSFGSGGFVLINTQFEDSGTAVVIQPDGKIVVGGYQNGGRGFVLVRLNSNGVLDATFGAGGKVVTVFEGSSNGTLGSIGKLAIQPDGKIIAFGNGGLPNPNRAAVALARYNSDGSLDNGFGNQGRFIINNSNSDTYFGGGELQPDGKILVAVRAASTNSAIVYRFTPTLALDGKFGRPFGKGFVRTQQGLGINELVVEPTGSFLVTDGIIRRYSDNGFFQTTFESAFVSFLLSNFYFPITSFARRTDGRIVGCGYRDLGAVNGRIDFLFAQYSREGELIGSDKIDYIGNDDYCFDVVIQPDNKILLIGSADPDYFTFGDSDFAVIRLLDITRQ